MHKVILPSFLPTKPESIILISSPQVLLEEEELDVICREDSGAKILWNPEQSSGSEQTS